MLERMLEQCEGMSGEAYMPSYLAKLRHCMQTQN